MSKRKDRECAFKIIFEHSFTDYEVSEIASLATESRDEEANANANEKAQKVFDHLDEIDAAIDRNLKGWNRQRVSRVAMSIMRLATYELLFEDDLDAAISLNEAVNLAKKYSTVEESSFINGVLNAVAKEVR